MILQPIEIDPALGPVPENVGRWIDEAQRAAKAVDCFDYVPSSAELLHAYLRVIPGKRYCEWGSGGGVGVGIAEMLGFEAAGLEVSPDLTALSNRLFNQFGLHAKVKCGSYHEEVMPADVVFVYTWSAKSASVRERFAAVMPPGSWLLIADGAECFSAFFRSCEGG